MDNKLKISFRRSTLFECVWQCLRRLVISMRWHMIHTRNSFKMTVGFGTIMSLIIDNSFYGSYLNLQDT